MNIPDRDDPSRHHHFSRRPVSSIDRSTVIAIPSTIMPTTTYTLPAGPPVAPKAYFSVTDDVAGLTTMLVNVFLIGQERSSDWVLIDAALPGFAHRIIDAAEARFGNSPPQAIILTHAHFDH